MSDGTMLNDTSQEVGNTSDRQPSIPGSCAVEWAKVYWKPGKHWAFHVVENGRTVERLIAKREAAILLASIADAFETDHRPADLKEWLDRVAV